MTIKATLKAENPYTLEWNRRRTIAKDAKQAKYVEAHRVKPELSPEEFKLLENHFSDEKPTNILAIGPFGSIYRRLIAPGLYQLNKAFKKATGKTLNLHWLLSDMYQEEKKKIKSQTARMKAKAESPKEASKGRLGYKETASVGYIPAEELCRALDQVQTNTDGQKYIEYQGKKHPIDIAFGTSLVDSHLSYAKKLAQAGITSVTEKPMTAPVDNKAVEEMDQVVTDQNKTFAADFFPYADASRILEENPDIVKGLGKLVAIHGTCVEPGGIEPGRGWLLNQNKSGGGLFIADTAPHPSSWADYMLNWFIQKVANSTTKVDTSSASIKAMDTYRLDKKDLVKPGVMTEAEYDEALKINPNIETHGTLNAKLKIPKEVDRELIADSIDINISAGKGAGGRPGGKGKQKHDKPSLGLELIFEHGRVELSTGYTIAEKTLYEPHVVRVPNEPSKGNPIKVYTAKGGKLGYNNMLVDWLLAAKGVFTDRFKAVSRAAKNSIKLMNKTFNHINDQNIKPTIYRLGEVLNPNKANIAFGWVNPLVASEDVDLVKSKIF